MSYQRYVIILAGGASARFWPFDGEAYPKFLLKPDGKTSLLESAFRRALSLTSLDCVLALTSESQSAVVQGMLPALRPENIIVEPCRRDTLAATTLGVESVFRRNPKSLVIVTPADVMIEPPDALLRPLESAEAASAFDEGRLYCFAVQPTRPETGFGYVQSDAKIAPGVYRAKRFLEKPDLATAQILVKDPTVMWNTGSFAWRSRDFLAAVEQLEPKLLLALREYLSLLPNQRTRRSEIFGSLRSTSVDYGIMERTPAIGVLKLEATFDDVGTWDALAALGQFKSGAIISVASSNCEARTEGTVAFVGCQDLVVVQHGDRLLVLRKGQGQAVKFVTQSNTEASGQTPTPVEASGQTPTPVEASGRGNRTDARADGMPASLPLGKAQGSS